MVPIICCVILLMLVPIPTSSNVAKLPNCADKNKDNRWVFVSTLDGKLSVLDYNDSGQEIWSIDTNPGPMLSSNIHRLELTNNGHWVRLIPSLAGSLYTFNGDTIDPIPITADNLLTASFKYLDDLVIAGGKELRTYGVVLNSGKLLYECSIHGCQNKTDYENYEDVILVERNTQTVRAVEPRSGMEKWNFSVAQLDLKFPLVNCHSDISNQKVNFNLQTVVPEGLVYAFTNHNQIMWKKHFNAPIVNVWTWDGYSSKPVDLFSSHQYSWGQNGNNVSPALYIGMHNKQLYVHESVILQQYLSINNKKDRNRLTEMVSVSHIPWKPFPATSSALATIDHKKIDHSEELDLQNQISTTALSVLYGSEYVNGNGFYLYASDAMDDDNNLLCKNNVTIEELEEEEAALSAEEESETPVQVIIVSLWYWWKEVAVIAITTAFALNIIINQHVFRLRSRYETITEASNTSGKDQSETRGNTPVYVKNHSESSDKEFISRYLTDFDPLHCLGRGGFGIVFEARNKIDECSYAVKRITLPNKSENRERVMREVKALAKLDHRNIVRFFNAWLESPPPEWIDEFDRVWKEDTYTDGLDYTTTKSPPAKEPDLSVVIDFSQSKIGKYYSSLDFKRTDGDMCSDSFIVFENSSKTNEICSSEDNTETGPSLPNESEKITKSKHSKSQSTLLSPEKVFLYIQMQLCQKESLKDWLRDNVKRSSERIRSIFEQIVFAVEYVHLKGLIHRDLKPSNIFFSMDGEIKVGDFGLVTGMEDCADEEEVLEQNLNSSEKHTRAVGTQLYMSPEQLKGLSYNYKVDIYSLGVILFELLVPFHTAMERTKTLCDLRHNIFPAKFCQEFVEEYELLKLMLSDCPENRPTTMGIRARPPLGHSIENCDYHFELPPRQRKES